ncbi:MAG: undecaprenyl-diphosphate phosphatase [Opitutales bacterium]|jgi:undecaprenyl-diphosphatase
MAATLFQIIILGLVQGAAELLPVSSSAHVIVAEKLMGLDPSSPEMTFLLVMLHTGTMLAVIAYFWKAWARNYFSSRESFLAILQNAAVATVFTFIVGYALKEVIEKVCLRGQAKAEIEDLFSSLPLIAGALAAAGVLIIISGLKEKKHAGNGEITVRGASLIGIVQGFCIPFRGFSRSGATISTGLLLGAAKRGVEEFSFALAVILTPPAIAVEFHRLIKAHPEVAHPADLVHLAKPGLFGMGCSFVAGLLALRLLSRWLEAGRWQYFGYYCVLAATAVLALAGTSYG